MENRCIAVITARGGSKRIPKKNIKEFCGIPILAYSINAALQSGIFEEVMVSTDDEEIKHIAKGCGATVPFLRSEETSNDFATTADVLFEVLSRYNENGRIFDYACCIYPTAPFVTGEKLKIAMESLKSNDADTVMTVVPYSFPPQRSLRLQDGKLVPTQPENMMKRSQDLEKIYHDCGQIYAVNVNRFMKSKRLVGEKVYPMIVNEMEAQDIDNMTDWKIAEMKYRILMEHCGNSTKIL